MGVPSCIHLGFLQLFDFDEVEFGGLPGGLEKILFDRDVEEYMFNAGNLEQIGMFESLWGARTQWIQNANPSLDW